MRRKNINTGKIAIILSAMLLLAGCKDGGNAPGSKIDGINIPDNNEVTSEKDTTDSNNTAGTDLSEEPTTESAAQNNTKINYPVLRIDRNNHEDEYISGFYDVILVDARYTDVDNNETIMQKLDTYAGDDYVQFVEQYNSYKEMSYEMAADVEDEEYMYNFYYTNGKQTTRVDNALISYVVTSDSYAGGVHGYGGIYGHTFDTKTGKEITKLEDIGDVRDDVRKHIDAKVESLRLEGYYFDFYEDGIDDILNERPNFYFDGQGLNFVLNAYDAGSYAEGGFVVEIPYSELPGLKEEYKLNPEEDYFIDIYGIEYYSDFKPVEIDINGDGMYDSIYEQVSFNEEWSEDGTIDINLSVGSNSEKITGYSGRVLIYFIRNKGKSYIMLSYAVSEESFETALYDVTDGFLTKKGAVNGEIITMNNGFVQIKNAAEDIMYNFSSGSFVLAE